MNIKEVIKTIEIAIACNVKVDSKYVFHRDYENKKTGNQMISILTGTSDLDCTDEIVASYNTMQHHGAKLYLVDCVLSVLGVKEFIQYRERIITYIMTKTRSEMLMEILYKRTFKEAIRGALLRQNSYGQEVSNTIKSNRFDYVYNKYLDWFRIHSVGTFTQGDLRAYFESAFNQIYYIAYKADIWNQLNEVDIAKKETDMKIIQRSVELEQKDITDAYIGTIMKDIYSANSILFKHSGSIKKVVYDIVYIIMMQKLQERVEIINSHLTNFHISLEDMLDIYGSSNDESNRIVEAKIKNGKHITRNLYEMISKKKFSIHAIGDVIDQVLDTGCSRKSDSACPWVLSRDLDHAVLSNIDIKIGTKNSDTGIINYQRVETILNGIIGVYTLFNALAERNISIASIYDLNAFVDIDLVRNMDYLSSIEHNTLIKSLQDESKTKVGNGVLYTFDEMVDNHAGSEQNGNIENKERRYRARLYGFLENPPLKKTKKYKLRDSKYDQIYNMFTIMHYLPRNINAYIDREKQVDSLPDGTVIFSPYMPLHVNNISLRENSILADKPMLAKKYFMHTKIGEQDKPYIPFNYLSIADINNAGESKKVVNVETLNVPTFNIFLGVHKSLTRQYMNTAESHNVDFFTSEQSAFNIAYVGISKMQDDIFRILYALSYISDNIIKDSYNSNEDLDDINSGVLDYCKKLALELYNNELTESILKSFMDYMFSIMERGGNDAAELIHIIDNNKYYINYNNVFRMLIMMRDKKDISALKELWAFTDEKYCQCEKTVLEECISLIGEDCDNVYKLFIYIVNYTRTKLEILTKLLDISEIMCYGRRETFKLLSVSLYQKFEIDNVFNIRSNTINGIKLDTINDNMMLSFMDQIIDNTFDQNALFINILKSYIGSCIDPYTKALDYNIMTSATTKSELQGFGLKFSYIPYLQPEDSIGLTKLRESYAKDSNGFFLIGGMYFVGYTEDNCPCYIHTSGNAVKINKDNSFIALDSINNLSSSDKGVKLDGIIRRGFNRQAFDERSVY